MSPRACANSVAVLGVYRNGGLPRHDGAPFDAECVFLSHVFTTQGTTQRKHIAFKMLVDGTRRTCVFPAAPETLEPFFLVRAGARFKEDEFDQPPASGELGAPRELTFARWHRATLYVCVFRRAFSMRVRQAPTGLKAHGPARGRALVFNACYLEKGGSPSAAASPRRARVGLRNLHLVPKRSTF